MSDIRFSVVIPLFNKAEYIEACLRSVASQTRHAHEILVVDDGSSDDGPDLVANFSHPSVRLIRLPPPGRNGEASRNPGIDAATGDWVAFLDADDSWGPTHLADIGAAVDAHPTSGFACTRYEHVFPDRKLSSHRSNLFDAAALRPLPLSEFLRLWVQTGECPAHTSACAARRDLLHAAGLFPKVMRGGDKDLWLRVAALTDFLFIPAASAAYLRDVPNAITSHRIENPLPVIVGTAEGILAGADAETRVLLTKLINQQILNYARFSFKNGNISAGTLKHIRLPEGLLEWSAIAMLSILPQALRSAIYKAVKAG